TIAKRRFGSAGYQPAVLISEARSTVARKKERRLEVPEPLATKDPICGMTVDPKKAAAALDYGGLPYYFCSKGCAAKFQQNPAKFLAATANPKALEHHDHRDPLAQIAAATQGTHACCANPS